VRYLVEQVSRRELLVGGCAGALLAGPLLAGSGGWPSAKYHPENKIAVHIPLVRNASLREY
jgi:hypothetical protein